MIRRRSPIARRVRPRQRRKGSRANLARVCAELWSKRVLAAGEGRCVAEGSYFRCLGPIDPAHCFGKKAHPSVRYELWNGVLLCRAHHDFLGNGRGWRDFLFCMLWGPALYAERYALACSTRRVDLSEVRRSLQGAE